MPTDIATMERIEKQKRDAIHSEVVVKNKERGYHIANTQKLNEARSIYQDSKGLDNISAHLKRKFDQIMLGT